MSRASTQLAVDGMTCAACVGRIERRLAKTPGVAEAVVNLATGRAEIAFDPTTTTPADLCAVINAAGYRARPATPDAPAEPPAGLHDFWLSAALGVPVLLLAMLPMLWPAFGAWLAAISPWQGFWDALQWLLATAILLIPGRRFFISGWHAARSLEPDMNTLGPCATAGASPGRCGAR